MNTTPAPPPAPDPDPTAAEDALMLADIKRTGMKLMRIVMQQAEDAEHAAPTGATKPPKASTLALAFHRITHSLCQAMAMADQLKRKAAPTKPSAANPPQRDAVSADDRARERKLKREARSYIAMQILADYEGEEMQKMNDTLDERLDDPTFMIEFGDAPIGVIVGTISDELKVKFNGSHFTDEELGAKWPEDMPGGVRKNPKKKIYPADYGYREEANRARLANGLPPTVIPGAEPPA